MLRFLNIIHDDLLKTLYDLSQASHRESWALDKSRDFKLCLHFIQFENIATACGFSWFANKMFKISSNFMDKVLKIIQLHEYHFSTNFTPLLYALAVQIWRIRQKFFKGHIIVKNSEFIETSINLKYIVQNNIIEVEKLKEAQKSKILKILCRAP
jgi:hypothetical protein